MAYGGERIGSINEKYRNVMASVFITALPGVLARINVGLSRMAGARPNRNISIAIVTVSIFHQADVVGLVVDHRRRIAQK